MNEAAHHRRRRSLVWTAILVLILAGGGYGAWRWYSERNAGTQQVQAAEPPPAIPVQAAVAERQDVPIYLHGLGNVQAFSTVVVRSRVDGQIEKIAFQEGHMVRKGDLLVQIDPRPFQAALDMATAKKAQDEAQLANAKLDLARYSQLASRDYASKQQLDTQQATVNGLTAQIQGDQAQIDNARTQLDYTTIRAPITGRAGFVLVDEGNIVHAADQNGIVQIDQLRPISVLFTAPEQQLAAIVEQVARGPLAVWALGPDGKNTLAEGEVRLVNNEVDAASGTIRLKATFPNEHGRLWPGLSVDTRLLLDTLKGVLAVPDRAIQRGPDHLYVYVIRGDDRIEMRNLTVGPITDGVAVVENGLSEGETVVTDGQYRLKPGDKVAVRGDRRRQAANAEP